MLEKFLSVLRKPFKDSGIVYMFAKTHDMKKDVKIMNTVPFEKLSKKQQRAENAKHRGSWGDVNPVTRTTRNPKAYDRAQSKRDWMA